MEQFDELTAFTHWWLATRPLYPSGEVVRVYQNMAATTLYKQGQYQVQLLSAKPNSYTPSHIHPNIDSYEIFVSGDLVFIIDGKRYEPQKNMESGMPTRIYPHYWHEGWSGPEGGSFLSIQKWLNGAPPSCVGVDWLGVDGSTSGVCVDTETKE